MIEVGGPQSDIHTMGQRNCFFPEMYSQSKPKDVNHSQLCITRVRLKDIASEKRHRHINAKENMHELPEYR